MTRIRLIVLAVLAVFCVSAIAATAASASKGEFVNKNGEALTKKAFTATSGETKLETESGQAVICTADLALGNITSTTGGEQTVHFTGCKSKSSGLSCKGVKPPAKAGEIIVLTGLLVAKLNATEDTLSNTILKEGTKTAGELEFECTGVKVIVRGTFWSNGVKTGAGPKELWPLSATIIAKGKQNITKSETSVAQHLETNFNGAGFEGSAEEGTETAHFLEPGEFI